MEDCGNIIPGAKLCSSKQAIEASTHTPTVQLLSSTLQASESKSEHGLMSFPTSADLSKGTQGRGRKGHTKSRTGCLNCKRARIKCKENKPSCTYCVNRGLQCVWPELQFSQAHHIPKQDATLEAEASIFLTNLEPSCHPTFSIIDFRLFNHFVDNAYPHWPPGNDARWKHEVPCISTGFDYLLHSMLALSASDIITHRPVDSYPPSLHLIALSHRTKAISALKAAVDLGITSSEQGNAMLATCFSLLFQSALIHDGLGEYMSFIRGCIAIGMQMGTRRYNFVFKGMWGDDQLQMLDPKLNSAPLIDSDVVIAGCRSLEKMAPLCTTRVELDMYSLLLSMARNLVTSSRDAYMTLRKVYELFSYSMPYPDFCEFINPANATCQLLQAHFVALQLVMTPITRNEWEDRTSMSQTKEGKTVGWLKNIHKVVLVIPEMRTYCQWTLLVEKEVYGGSRLLGGKHKEHK